MNLTDEQKTALNVGLATWEGYIWLDPLTPGGRPMVRKPDGDWVCASNYCGDLNAINRLEERLTLEQHREFRCYLRLHVLQDMGLVKSMLHSEARRRAYVSASAEQRAIALARTLSLTIEGVTQ